MISKQPYIGVVFPTPVGMNQAPEDIYTMSTFVFPTPVGMNR